MGMILNRRHSVVGDTGNTLLQLTVSFGRRQFSVSLSWTALPVWQKHAAPAPLQSAVSATITFVSFTRRFNVKLFHRNNLLGQFSGLHCQAIWCDGWTGHWIRDHEAQDRLPAITHSEQLSCLHTCASVTEQWNLPSAIDGDALQLNKECARQQRPLTDKCATSIILGLTAQVWI